MTGSFRDGIAASDDDSVCLALVNVFDNNPNISNVDEVGTSCIGTKADGGSGRRGSFRR